MTDEEFIKELRPFVPLMLQLSELSVPNERDQRILQKWREEKKKVGHGTIKAPQFGKKTS